MAKPNKALIHYFSLMKKTKTWSRKIYKNGVLEKIVEVEETTITTVIHEPKKWEVKAIIRYLKKLRNE